MIIIGDKFIPYEKIESIKKIEDIKETKPNTTLLLDFDKELMSYCVKNEIQYAVNITEIKEALYSNALKAKYILPPLSIIAHIQKIAENYLFDSKILASIDSDDEIEALAVQNIDGVIFKNLFKEA
ncbi:MAG: hypothetical protein U9Q33_05645 [Campylobacterota bacterium]|nr:hypothetical protein [Campylobacterota bacterium]